MGGGVGNGGVEVDCEGVGGIGVGEVGGGVGLVLGQVKIRINAIIPAAASHHSRLRLFSLTHAFRTLSACFIACQVFSLMLFINVLVSFFITTP